MKRTYKTFAISTLRQKSGFRYFAVVVLGFCIDLSVAWSTYAFLGYPLAGAALIGFLVAMTTSYFVHEFWTFQRSTSAVSAKRFAKFTLASAATLGARLLFVWLASGLTALPGGALAQLLIAYCGSLIVGFLMNRKVVFTD